MSISDISFGLDLIRAARRGDATAVAHALTGLGTSAYTHTTAPHALVDAATHGHTECVRLLIPHSTSKAANTQALRFAAENGHAGCVKLLISVSDPKANDSSALSGAAHNGHTECVRLLLSGSDAKAQDSRALILAAFRGHTDMVRLLLPHSDPLARNSVALLHAVQGEHQGCVELLLAHSDAAGVLHTCNTERAQNSICGQMLRDFVDAQQQKNIITAEIGVDTWAATSLPTRHKHKI